jgi:hypothetical protein
MRGLPKEGGKKVKHFLGSVAVSLIMLTATAAWADTEDCRGVLDQAFAGRNNVQVTVSALHITGSLGSAEGTLYEYALPALSALHVYGTLTEYFSDRLTDGHPGDPNTSEQLTIEIYPDTPPFTIAFRSDHWGSRKYTFVPTCDYDVMYGFGGPAGNVRDVFYTVKFLPAP